MKCYTCHKIAEYSCKCSIPNILMCKSHLKNHQFDTTKYHILEGLEPFKDTRLFIEIKDKLMKIYEEIIIDSNKKITEIKEKTFKTVDFINNLLKNLYESYFDGKLTIKFVKKIINNCPNEFESITFKKYILKKIEYKSLIKAEKEELSDNFIDNIEKNKEDAAVVRKGHGSIQFLNGDIYKGKLKISMFEGKGVYQYKNGDVYKGKIKNCYRSGTGALKSADGNIVEGLWRNDKFSRMQTLISQLI